ncbi:uncharacterized protein K444DRAFT_536848 [Hyaloscypha bicolor E]|uniref:Uncharacterized protein n=1 Tax=Hyaloscypha bicolor E TaxID=1095630 RepID=A0A2J6SYE8_9HELO|nr:uncharacterized protein K444DRAFT_536848 [Hyaloscypha bicolor E]PMD55787.1 hypothetical protein K444DRAFT_536848 [Hyaloscypha bicolor E]
MSSNNQTPDLASILKTLASLAPQAQQQQVQPPPQPHPLPTPFPAEQVWQQSLVQATQPSHTPTPSAAPKVVDPATIIEWSAGLRCVMKQVAKHESILQDVRRMIKVQHEHEEQWWEGRKALIERQKARKEGQKKLDDVLKAVGGSTAAGTSNTSPEELEKELETFDMKVYKAQTQMVKEMSTKLRGLGVPFFGTRVDLVRPTGKESSGTEGSVGLEEKGMIDEVELVRLQRKMLAILEDLCND